MAGKVKSDDRTITVRIPIAIRHRGGKKLVLAPDGKAAPSFSRRIDNAMVKAIARAFRWQELLENGTYATIAEIADAEKINESYVSRVFRLTLLAPDIIEMVIDGRQPPELDLASLMGPLSPSWPDQRERFATAVPVSRPQTRSNGHRARKVVPESRS
jgi:hypothetical protein